MSEYEAISTEKEDDTFRIVLDRPHRMNAINDQMAEELTSALEEAESVGGRCIVISGEGGNFSTGADVTMFRPEVEFMHEASRMGKEITSSIEDSPIPVVAAIRGYCLGGGLELSLSCDFRIAAEDAELGNPEINLGIIPGWGGTQRLVRIVGLDKAKEIVMLGDRFSAEEALEMGLVNKVVPIDDFEDEVNEFATKLAEGPPIALEHAKYALNYGSQVPMDVGLSLESSLFGSLAATKDMMEGIEAFMEKRKPEFEGE